MKSPLFKYSILLLILVFLSAGQLVCKPSDYPITFKEEIDITGRNNELLYKKTQEWIVNNYSKKVSHFEENKIITQGSFKVASRNFFGKTTKFCNYTLSIVVKENTCLVIISKIYYSWYRRPMHKGDFGGWQTRTLESVSPPEEKVPLEKKAYIQYIDQTTQGIHLVIKQVKTVLEAIEN
ncbi:MAG TPA: DUF4468 domain-containing protein [Cytophagaceae bacterium]|jgi:hypothetical protein